MLMATEPTGNMAYVRDALAIGDVVGYDEGPGINAEMVSGLSPEWYLIETITRPRTDRRGASVWSPLRHLRSRHALSAERRLERDRPQMGSRSWRQARPAAAHVHRLYFRFCMVGRQELASCIGNSWRPADREMARRKGRQDQRCPGRSTARAGNDPLSARNAGRWRKQGNGTVGVVIARFLNNKSKIRCSRPSKAGST